MTSSTGNDPFVGRELEMAELSSVLENALRGEGQLAMLAGQPGIGKTRLTEELSAVARDRGAVVTLGSCYEGGGTPPYWPWIQAIRSLLTEPSDEIIGALETRAAVIAEIVPEIKDMAPRLDAVPKVDPEQARFRLFDSVTSFLFEIAISQPMVVVLDDLHWADHSSLDLLEFISREVATSPMLIIGGYRDMELSRGHPLAKSLATLARARGFKRVHLRGLGSGEVDRMVEVIGDITLPSDLIEEIHVRTEGNPFFVKEVARDLAREVAERGGNFDSVKFRIPEGVREAIGVRLDNLSEQCNQVLRTAAIIGREFDFKLLAEVSAKTSEDELLVAVEEALNFGAIQETSATGERYEFTHALVQETLANELSTSRRARLHARIVEALELSGKTGGDQRISELAHHSAEAESIVGVETAAHYSLMAGEHALATYAWEAALDHFQRGLAANEDQDTESDKGALLFGLARAQTRSLERYRVHEAATTARSAFDYYVAVGDIPTALTIAEYPFISPRESPAMAQLLTEALKLVPPDSHRSGQLLARYGASIQNLDFESTVEVFNNALTIARRVNDRALELTVLNGLAASQWMMQLNPRASLENSLRAVDLSLGVSKIPLDFIGHYWATVALIAVGDLEGARPHAGAHLAMEEKRGDRFGIAQGFHTSATVAQLQGDWKTARDFSERGLAVDDRDSRLVHNRAKMEYELGNFDQGDDSLNRLVETMRLSPPGATPDYSLAPLAIGTAARITGRARYFDIAESAINTVLSSPSTVSFYSQLVRTALGLIAVERGDVTVAKEQYDFLDSFGITLTLANHTCGHRVLGLLAKTIGRLDDAVAHFEDSLDFCRKAGARPELAWTSFDYGIALIQRDEPSDHAMASLLLDEAVAISTELGMVPLAKQVTTLQKEISASPVKPLKYPAGLTMREVEVLRLIASGKTTIEVANELVISPRTVQRHTTNLYAKINARNRAEATAFVLSNLANISDSPSGA